MTAGARKGVSAEEALELLTVAKDALYDLAAIAIKTVPSRIEGLYDPGLACSRCSMSVLGGKPLVHLTSCPVGVAVVVADRIDAALETDDAGTPEELLERDVELAKAAFDAGVAASQPPVFSDTETAALQAMKPSIGEIKVKVIADLSEFLAAVDAARDAVASAGILDHFPRHFEAPLAERHIEYTDGRDPAARIALHEEAAR